MLLLIYLTPEEIKQRQMRDDSFSGSGSLVGNWEEWVACFPTATSIYTRGDYWEWKCLDLAKAVGMRLRTLYLFI